MTGAQRAEDSSIASTILRFFPEVQAVYLFGSYGTEYERPPRSAEFYARLNTLAAEVLARHADKSPRHYTIADSK